jgi:hypothetical protein
LREDDDAALVWAADQLKGIRSFDDREMLRRRIKMLEVSLKAARQSGRCGARSCRRRHRVQSPGVLEQARDLVPTREI